MNFYLCEETFFFLEAERRGKGSLGGGEREKGICIRREGSVIRSSLTKGTSKRGGKKTSSIQRSKNAMLEQRRDAALGGVRNRGGGWVVTVYKGVNKTRMLSDCFKSTSFFNLKSTLS